MRKAGSANKKKSKTPFNLIPKKIQTSQNYAKPVFKFSEEYKSNPAAAWIVQALIGISRNSRPDENPVKMLLHFFQALNKFYT
jgi:hypothetical protein